MTRRRDPERRRPAVGVRARAVVGLLLVGAANAACYTYAPVPFTAVAPKEDVRVRVTEDAAVRLAKDLGTFSSEIDGQLAPEGRDSISLGVAIDRTYRGTTIGSSTQQLFLARSEVLEVRRREFSRSRTVLLTAGTLVGFAGLAAGITQLLDPNGAPDGSTTPPPPPASPNRRRIIRIQIPFP
ncbi:MAG: hypothetical protein ACREBE_17345 [bacterium]